MMRHGLNILYLLLSSAILVVSFGIADGYCGFLMLPRDDDGWTVFTPSVDSRIMYVSADGNDATGKVYKKNDFDDPFNPQGEFAFATYDAAFAHARNGYPDWILFRRGDVFKDQTIGKKHIKGRSLSEPALIGFYGSAGPCPVLKTPPGTDETPSYAFYSSNGPIDYLAIVGIDFYAYTRNPEDPDYISEGNLRDYGLFSVTGAYVSDGILFEGCKFRYYAGNIISTLNRPKGGKLYVQFRRCSFIHNYGSRSSLYSRGATKLEIYQCIFDHNSWYSRAGSGGLVPADKFSHSVYIEVPVKLIFKEDIVLRSSSGGFKQTNYESGLPTDEYRIDNCLFVDNEFAATAGTGPHNGSSYISHLYWVNNIISRPGRSNQTNRELAMGFTFNSFKHAVIANNLFIHQPLVLSNAQSVLEIGRDGGLKSAENMIIKNNILYGLRGMSGIKSPSGITAIGMVVAKNKFQIKQDTGYLVDLNSTSGWSFSDNYYYSDKPSGSRFKINGAYVSDDRWFFETGDNSKFLDFLFPDSTRDVDTYMGYIGGVATIDGFIAAQRAQGRFNWDDRLEAGAINKWIRDGFFAYIITSPPGDFDMP